MYYSFYFDLGMLFVRILNSKPLLSLLVGNGCRTDAEFFFFWGGNKYSNITSLTSVPQTLLWISGGAGALNLIQSEHLSLCPILLAVWPWEQNGRGSSLIQMRRLPQVHLMAKAQSKMLPH